MARNFKLILSIKKISGEQSVFFKMDGGRFETERTLKLNRNTKYGVDITVRPAQVLKNLKIHGGNVSVEDTSKDDNQSLYHGEWISNGMEADKKGKRQQITSLIELEGIGTVKITLQCKFYPEMESSHVKWGTPLTYIEYDCKVPENAAYIDIVKTTFR